VAKIKVAVSFIFYPVAMGHYFLRALRRRENIDVWTCGVFTGSWIPWNNGMYVPSKYVVTPNLILPSSCLTHTCPGEFITAQMPFTPDLVLVIDAGLHFSTRPKGKVVVHIKTDPHVLDQHYSKFAKQCDLSFCMQDAYMKEGDIYLPYAYDPTIHYNTQADKETDGCIVGLQYENRVNLATSLIQKGHKIHCNIGEVYDEYRNRYNKSRIAISWSSLNDTPARVFEAFGMNIPLLCNRTPDLTRLGYKEYEHYVGFSNLQDAIDGFDYLLGNYENSMHMANSAYKLASSQDTWDHRIDTILHEAGYG
jgi:hypothetical protein